MRVELVRSVAGCTKRQIRTVMALGLRDKIGTVKIHKDNPAIRGMCNVVEHLIKVEPTENK
ncbi:MAG: 50S ribosomal protein L30 [Firmicutes bacterium]|nr:50S ribosomal protein L30 [Bacillota bacterium]